MSTKTISQLTAGSTPDGTELIEVVQSGNSRRLTIQQAADGWASGSGPFEFGGNFGVGGEATFTGRVGVGADPDTTLHATSADVGEIRITSGSANFAQISMGDTADPDECRLRYSNVTQGFDIFTAGSEAFKIDNSGNVEVPAGNVVIGTSGNGIDFSATSGTGTSELLDDYEEGTWTPVVADAASGGNEATVLASNGFYTKIGNTVHATCQLVNINTTGLTAGNNVFITGLPFTAVATTYTTLFVSAATTLYVAFSDTPNAVVHDATNYVQLAENVSGGGYDLIVVSELTSGSARVYFTLTYQAA